MTSNLQAMASKPITMTFLFAEAHGLSMRHVERSRTDRRSRTDLPPTRIAERWRGPFRIREVRVAKIVSQGGQTAQFDMVPK